MAYGRLDIYWPDGPIESYQIEKASTAIGRSSGNDIVLDTTAVSRYHVSLTRKDGQIILVDLGSANGTYLDGQRVTPHEPYPLRGGEEIQIGDVRLIFQPEQTEQLEHTNITTKPILPDTQSTRRIEIVQPSYKVELDSPDSTVTPGAHIQASLGIQNIGEETDRYFVEVNGVSKEWVRMDRSELELEPGLRAQVIISFKPLRRSESAPGEYPVTIRVRSKSKPSQAVEAPLLLRVLAYSGFGIALGTPRIDAQTPFEVHIHNQGSGPLPLALSGASPDGSLAFDIRPRDITLGPGERRIIRGYARPQRAKIVGQTGERRFDIQAHSKDAAGFLTAVQGTFVEKPVMPMWMATVVLPITIALILLGVAGVGLLYLSRPRTPVISSFTASPAQALEGESVELAWTVTNANELLLQVDDGRPVAIDPTLGKLTQVVTGAGERIFTLIARSGGEAVQREARVLVSTPMKIDTLTVSPNPVLRNVNQEVTIAWKTEGTVSVQFRGVEALTGTPDQGTHPASGELRLAGTPRDTLELTLVAIAADGKQVTQPIRVEIVNPSCTASGSQVQIHGGPGTIYPVSGTLAANAQVTPDGRDQSGEWIHLAPSPDPQAWIPVRSVTCDRFDPSALTLITSVPPTPTAAPSATATQTPTLTPIQPPTVTVTRAPTEAPTAKEPQIVPTWTPVPATSTGSSVIMKDR